MLQLKELQVTQIVGQLNLKIYKCTININKTFIYWEEGQIKTGFSMGKSCKPCNFTTFNEIVIL